MLSEKMARIKKDSKCGKYPHTFSTCLKMIPTSIQDKLPAHDLAKLVDVINDSYENGHTAGWREAR